MDATYSRHTRKSHPNLQNFTFAPLTPHNFYDPSGPHPSSHPPPSYISPKSLPQTPSILSRSSSRSNLAIPSYKSIQTLSSLNKAKAPARPLITNHHKTNSSQSTITTSAISTNTTTIPQKPSTTADWLLQTASHLTLSTLESKGQSWLATRSSSTSLLIQPPSPNTNSYQQNPYSYSFATTDNSPLHTASTLAFEADDEYSPFSARARSPFSTRARSRAHSRSRPISRFSSQVRLYSLDGKEQIAMEMSGPDFVDADEEVEEMWMADGEEMDEGEMKSVVWGRVGGWVDWAVGWMDFRVDGDGKDVEEKEGDGSDESGDGGLDKEKAEEAKENEDEREMAVEEKVLEILPPVQGGWRDAKWLLDVAAKIVL
ncbi:hypothetical protein MMC12_003198 [Toensbergia leucococca]|nr:hypothetical protein [Toensbergia leucococca]